MASDITGYHEAAEVIKTAILQAQYAAAKSANAKQLQLYYVVGGYLLQQSKLHAWGSGALDTISETLQKELPGLRGFSSRNLRFMRTFYAEWCLYLVPPANLELASSKSNDTQSTAIWNWQVPNVVSCSLEDFLSVGFTHHRWIISLSKNLDERLFYIHKCAAEHLSVDALKRSLEADDYHHLGATPNNFLSTLPKSQQALRAISTFKDQYLLDFINVEELGVRDVQDVDERVLEQGIIQNIKQFIMTFGRGFSFVGNQYHLDAFDVDQYIDLLFFNRDLNCLVAVELKSGPFKTAYLGQLSGYLRVLDDFERREHENPSIGLVLCKDMDRAFVDYVIQDYRKPMGVATYKTSKDMSQELLDALPPIDGLKALLEEADT